MRTGGWRVSVAAGAAAGVVLAVADAVELAGPCVDVLGRSAARMGLVGVLISAGVVGGVEQPARSMLIPTRPAIQGLNREIGAWVMWLIVADKKIYGWGVTPQVWKKLSSEAPALVSKASSKSPPVAI